MRLVATESLEELNNICRDFALPLLVVENQQFRRP